MKIRRVIAIGLYAGALGAYAEVSNLVERVKVDISTLNYEERIPYIDSIIKEQEDALAKFYRVRANSHYALGDFRSAEMDYRKALPLSKSGNLEYAIGKCLYEQVKYHEALAMFRLADERRTHEAARHEAYQYKYHIALCLFEIKKYDESIAMYEQLRKDYPEEDMTAVFDVIDAYKKQEHEKAKGLQKKNSKKEAADEAGSTDES